jgi:hypothetical protein
MKTQKLIRHVIAAWFQKHGRGGFQLVWQPTKRDENGVQYLILGSITDNFKLTIHNGVFRDGATVLRSESALAKFLGVERAFEVLSHQWVILALESFYQKFYEVKDALEYLSVKYDGETGNVEIDVGREGYGAEVSHFSTNDPNMRPEFFEHLAMLYNFKGLEFICNYPEIPEYLSLTKFECVLEYAIRAALHNHEQGMVIEQHLDKWRISFVTKDDNGNDKLLECERAENNAEDPDYFTVNGEMHNTDSFFDMLTFPNSAEKTQKIFYDTKNLIELLNSYRFASSEIIIKNCKIHGIDVTIDTFLTTGEVKSYHLDFPEGYSLKLVEAFILKIVDKQG